MSRRRQKRQSGWELIFLFIMLVLALVYVLYSRQEQAAPPPAAGGSLEVHFIDVGQADAALVICDGHYMLIDGGNAEDSGLVYAYLKEHGAEHLDYMVATHAHEDHVGGLSGALNYASVDAALCPVRSYDSKGFQNMVKYLEKQGKSIAVPRPGTASTWALPGWRFWARCRSTTTPTTPPSSCASTAGRPPSCSPGIWSG